MTNKLAFILDIKWIFLKDRPPAQPHEGPKGKVRIERIVHVHRWIDINDDLLRVFVIKANDI